MIRLFAKTDIAVTASAENLLRFVATPVEIE
jgi:hypothetical protein